MVCPFGSECDTSVIDSRKTNEGIRRRRECSTCKLRFTTYENADLSVMVLKRSGDVEEFNYEKLYQGVDYAFGGLDINEKKLKTLVDNIYILVEDCRDDIGGGASRRPRKRYTLKNTRSS